MAEGQTRASRSFSFSSNRPNIWTSPISPPAGSAAHLHKHDIRWFTPPATWFLSCSPCCPVVLTKSLSQQILIGLHVPSLSSNGPHPSPTLYTVHTSYCIVEVVTSVWPNTWLVRTVERGHVNINLVIMTWSHHWAGHVGCWTGLDHRNQELPVYFTASGGEWEARTEHCYYRKYRKCPREQQTTAGSWYLLENAHMDWNIYVCKNWEARSEALVSV